MHTCFYRKFCADITLHSKDFIIYLLITKTPLHNHSTNITLIKYMIDYYYLIQSIFNFSIFCNNFHYRWVLRSSPESQQQQKNHFICLSCFFNFLSSRSLPQLFKISFMILTLFLRIQASCFADSPQFGLIWLFIHNSIHVKQQKYY